MTRSLLFLVALLAFPHSALLASDRAVAPAIWDPGENAVLIPVLADRMPGAGDSLWDTDVTITNVSDEPVVYYLSPCNIACCCEETNTIRPQSSLFFPMNYPRGAWFGLLPNGSIQLGATLRNRSRSEQSAGVALPIVRHSEFRTTELNIIGIPRLPGFRTMVRLYALESGVSLTVEEISWDGRVTQQHTVTLDPPRIDEHRLVPAYAQLTIPPVASEEHPIRLRVRSVTAGSHFWALASLTSNTTQEVTLFQP